MLLQLEGSPNVTTIKKVTAALWVITDFVYVGRTFPWNTHGRCHQARSVGHMHDLWGTATFRLMTGAQ